MGYPSTQQNPSKNSYPGSGQDPLGLPDPLRSTLDPMNIAPYYAGPEKKAPPPKGADLVGAANTETASNRPNINTPFSSQGWAQDKDGKWTFNTNLSPQAQAAIGNAPPVDYSKLPGVESGDKARQQAFDASYNQATSRLDPEWSQREEQMHSQLANQGLDPNSAAARNAMQQFENSRGDAYSQARNSAIGQSREAGNDVFRNSELARQQALSEAMGAHELPLQDLLGQMGLMQSPGFHSAADLLGALQGEQNYNLSSYQQDHKNRAGGMGGLMSLLQLFA